MSKTEKATSLGAARERVRTAGQNGGMINDNNNGIKTYVAALQNNPNQQAARRYPSKNDGEQATKFLGSVASSADDHNDRYKNATSNSTTREKAKPISRFALKKPVVPPPERFDAQ